jgi:dephospho-CoA kinase
MKRGEKKMTTRVHESIHYLDFKSASYVINVCLLKGLSLLVIGKNGIGKTKLAECFAKAFSKIVIPVGAIDMGGLRQILEKEENESKTHLIISDLQAFNRSRESRQKLISYIVNLTTDNSFFDLSYDSKVKRRKNPLQSIIFGTPEDLEYLFREGKKHFLDRFLVIFVDREVDTYIIRNKIEYKLEIEPIFSIAEDQKISYELSQVLIPLSHITVRKKEQVLLLSEGLYEVGYNGTISIYNHSEQPINYEHYYDRVWLNSPLDIEINQQDYEHWSVLLRTKPEENDLRWKDWYPYLVLSLKRSSHNNEGPTLSDTELDFEGLSELRKNRGFIEN